MTIKEISALVATMVALSEKAAAQSPSNDNFADRIPLAGTSFEITANAFGATLEPNDPTRVEWVEYINREHQSYEYSTNIASTWWTWTPPVTGYAYFSVVAYPFAYEDFRPLFVLHRGDRLEDLSAATRVGELSVWPEFYASMPITAGQTYSLAFVNDVRTNANFTVRVSASATPVILQHPQSQTIRAGGACALTVLAPGCMTNGNIQWQHNGANIPGANGPTLLVHNATVASAGEYRALVNIQNPSAITVSQPAILTVEGEDIAPELRLVPSQGLSGSWNIQVIGETNQHYVFEQSTNLATGFAALGSSQFIPHSGAISLQASASNMELLRAVRAGDMAQRCIANLRRVDFAKEAWRVIYSQANGAAVNVTQLDELLDGLQIQCPLGGDFHYGSLGSKGDCSYAGHARD